MVGVALALTGAALAAQDLSTISFDDAGYRQARAMLTADDVDRSDLQLALATLAPRIAEGAPEPGRFHGLWIAGLILQRAVRELADAEPRDRAVLVDVANGCVRLFARGQQWTWFMSPRQGGALLSALERLDDDTRLDALLAE